MDIHFLVMEKLWKINVEKEGTPCTQVSIKVDPKVTNNGHWQLCCQHVLDHFVFHIWGRGLFHSWRHRPHIWAHMPSPCNEGLALCSTGVRGYLHIRWGFLTSYTRSLWRLGLVKCKVKLLWCTGAIQIPFLLQLPLIFVAGYGVVNFFIIAIIKLIFDLWSALILSCF